MPDLNLERLTLASVPLNELEKVTKLLSYSRIKHEAAPMHARTAEYLGWWARERGATEALDYCLKATKETAIIVYYDRETSTCPASLYTSQDLSPFDYIDVPIETLCRLQQDAKNTTYLSAVSRPSTIGVVLTLEHFEKLSASWQHKCKLEFQYKYSPEEIALLKANKNIISSITTTEYAVCPITNNNVTF